MRRIDRNRHGVEPDQRALHRNAKQHIERLLGLGGAGGGHAGVAGVGQRQADLALGQVVDMLAAADVAQVRLQLGEQLLRGLEVSGGDAVGILAQVVQRDRNHLLRRVQYGDAAVFQLAGVLRLEQQIQAVQRHTRQTLLDRLLV